MARFSLRANGCRLERVLRPYDRCAQSGAATDDAELAVDQKADHEFFGLLAGPMTATQIISLCRCDSPSCPGPRPRGGRRGQLSSPTRPGATCPAIRHRPSVPSEPSAGSTSWHATSASNVTVSCCGLSTRPYQSPPATPGNQSRAGRRARVRAAPPPRAMFGLPGFGSPGFSGGRVPPAAVAGGTCFHVCALLVFDRGGVSDRRERSVFVEPVHPGQAGEFELVDGSERSVGLDALGLVELDNGLGQDVDAPLFFDR